MMQPVHLVTGAAGMIGSSLVRHLLGAGTCRIVASDIAPNPANLQDVLERVEYVHADVASFESVLRLFERYHPESVYHLGAMLGPGCDAAPRAGIQSNALGTYHVLEAARLFGTRQVLFASSFTVLSGGPEGADAVIDDYSATRPEGIYAAAKLFSENLGLAYRRMHGLDFRSLRLPGIVGPGVRGHGFFQYVSQAIHAALAGEPYSVYVAPETRVPLMYVDDVARAFTDLAGAPRERIRAVNYLVLGPSPVPSAQQIVERVRARIPGARLDFKVDPEVQTLFARLPQSFDDRYARDEWGWRPRYGLDGLIEAFICEQRGRCPR